MNWRQLIVLWIGVFFFVGCALNTSTHYKHKTYNISDDGQSVGFVAGSDWGPMFGRLMSTVVVTGAAIYTFRTRKKVKE